MPQPGELSGEIISVLVDPVDRLPLQYVQAERCLYNERTRRIYRVTSEGIPVLLADDAETVSDDEHKRLLDLIAGGHTRSTGSKGTE